jgi:hypothetical protein
MPNNELHHVMTEEVDVDVAPREYWELRNDKLAKIFLDFLASRGMAERARQ